MQLEKFGLSVGDAEQLVKGVSEGHYGLLLGAGFSMSAKDRSGRFLPSGPGLGKELNDLLSLGFDDVGERNLSDVFQEAMSTKDGEDKVLKYLKNRFVGVDSTWHEGVLEFPWTRIWTLNIDDLFERAGHGNGVARPVFITWKDSLAPPSMGSNQVQVVYLHGRASTLPSSVKSLVFSIRDYVKATRGQGDWHAEFWSKWLQTPFLVVGARLVDEFDLANAIHAGSKSREATGFPSIAVIKDLAAVDRRKLERGGVVPIDADAESFFSALKVDVYEYRRVYAEITQSPIFAGVSARFNQQFEVLVGDRKYAPRHHDFYGGDEPVWADVDAGLDADRVVVGAAITKLIGAAESGSPSAVVFKGMPGAGRSTSLLRLGKEFISRGYRVFKFREVERPDVEACVNWIRANPKTLLLFDNAADFSGSVKEVLEGCLRAGVSCLAAVAERDKRAVTLGEDLRDFLVGVFEVGPAVRPDVIAIADKRRAAARMGDATEWSDQRFWKYIDKDYSGDLFMGLSALERSRGFNGRIDREWDSLVVGVGEAQLSAIKAVSVVNRFGYSLPVSVYMDVSGVSVVSDISSGFGETDVIFLDSRGYRFRHRMFAEHIFRAILSQPEKYDLSLRVARSLAPLVSASSMKRRTYPVLMLRQLMDKDSVIAASSNIDSARRWYAELESCFGWNGRFWDQRALLESDSWIHDRAYSYAKKSVSVHRHAFSLNTLGRVRLKASVDDSIDLATAWGYFKEGEAYLQESLSHAISHGDLHEHPFMTAFSYMADFSKRLPSRDARFLELDQIRQKWSIEVNRLKVKSPGVLERMDLVQAEILKRMIA